jgi:cell division protein FtsB
MNVDLGIWNKLTRVVIFLLFVAVLLGVGVWYLPLIKENERVRKRILVYDNKIQKEVEAGKQLKASIEALHHDPKAVERVARETLGYAKAGETVIRFEAPATNAESGALSVERERNR